MPIDFRNLNTLWASIAVETLSRLGLTTAIICPGSRSAPLAVAFAQHPQIEAISVLDERSAAFFALGIAQRSHRPVALVCTSGTAGANFYPAVIEAQERCIPLILMTADRPPELRQCNSGQTIDQQKLFGTFPNAYHELAVPDVALLPYLRQTIIHAWERSRVPVAGVVHLNVPFRDPLAPVAQPEIEAMAEAFPADFFAAIAPEPLIAPPFFPQQPVELPTARWLSTSKGIIIAGVAQPEFPQPYCEAIAQLSRRLGFPVLAEGLSPVRNWAERQPALISTYDLMLRNPSLAKDLAPEVVIRIGDMPTSKELRQWLERSQPQQWVIDPSDRNLDPLHGKTTHLRLSVEQVAKAMAEPLQSWGWHDVAAVPSDYLERWRWADGQLRQKLDAEFAQTEEILEPKVTWLVSQTLPPDTPVFVANSMPVRDVEWFWKPNDRGLRLYFNRGANGIDGTLSTALGVVQGDRSAVLLTGDLAFLHDTNGLLLASKLNGHLTVIVVNNNGGGIFEMLPISEFDPPFESFFATPQTVDFEQLCAAYGVAYEKIVSWSQLQERLSSLPTHGIRVLEIPTNRKSDAQWRKTCFQRSAEGDLSR